MFDQSHGLRFDIYERIHLSEELPGIAELEEVELIPDIKVIQREDRAELYGQLLLTGLYRGEDDRTQRLEHAIPVEITVPLTRVSSLEDIGVEIENFDIDLLTMRTVNITGVLSLRGIGSADAQPAWQQEEYTVAYSPAAGPDSRAQEGDVLYENSLWTYGEGVAEVPVEEQEYAAPAEAAGNPLFLEGSVYTQPAAFVSAQLKDKEPRARTHSLDSAGAGASPGAAAAGQPSYSQPAAEPVSSYFLSAREKAEAPPVRDTFQAEPVSAANYANPFDRAEASYISALPQDEDPGIPAGTAAQHWGNVNLHAVQPAEPAVISAASEAAEAIAGNEELPEVPEEIQAAENVSLEAEEVLPLQEEKQDLKIGLGSKQEPGAIGQEPLTFSSLLSSSRANKELEVQNSERNAPKEAAIPEPGNDTEWKSRFIGGLSGAELFRKVRLCIVQREETLDTIAEKYQLSARELSMYNRLSGQSVEEGQVLYIP
ncbi:LysM peptidoglycan-binding domain-containing protein [Paenibacillus sp. MMS20-IR301]|uniref:LysM peptidoglycan-binding domain-containing protein n=1 Tax=Paenibacillus sp. MMS20-IR301 TaxID=2895946 RepID=UPI0028EFCEB8|nr:LysM peptidoglycan-binding domain-containing protein [Paenibacillus sp. MMS20-IR301]WNS43577.1 LysM peptidoglycan-binding domain-containing protein [Paenibacillus sp. MMS20-IR301]